MSVLGSLRRLLLREHEREHAEVNRHLEQADESLTAHEIRLRRLEIELRLRGRRLGGQ